MKTKAVKILKSKKHPILEETFRVVIIIFGALCVAIGLEAFLIPNGFLDGGITGLSIILAKFIQVPMGVILGILNIPFIILTWIKVGHRSAIRTAVGVATLTVATIVLHHMEPWTTEFFLALAYGGGLLGLGIGLALRQGGALDGTEALAAILADKTTYRVDQFILGFNIVVFTVAGFIVGPQEALASAALFYLAVAPMIERVVESGGNARRARVVTQFPMEVAEKMNEIVHGRVLQETSRVYVDGEFSEVSGDISFTLPRMQEAAVTDAILEIDPEAIVVFLDIASLRGGVYEKPKHGH